MITKKMSENAHKLVFLVEQYPEHTITQLMAMLQMPAVDINCAFWAAEELGFISEPVKETGEVKLLETPKEWKFGDVQEELQAMIIYSFNKLAHKEEDLEETYLQNWLNGYSTHDVFVALKTLLNKRILGEYQLTDPNDLESTYTFYSLFPNTEQLWGRKQFKVAPVGDEKPAEQENKEDETAPAN